MSAGAFQSRSNKLEKQKENIPAEPQEQEKKRKKKGKVAEVYFLHTCGRQPAILR
jgi:hypothetical protein